MTIAASLVALAMSGCTVIISTGIFTDVSTTHGVQIVGGFDVLGRDMLPVGTEMIEAIPGHCLPHSPTRHAKRAPSVAGSGKSR